MQFRVSTVLASTKRRMIIENLRVAFVIVVYASARRCGTSPSRFKYITVDAEYNCLTRVQTTVYVYIVLTHKDCPACLRSTERHKYHDLPNVFTRIARVCMLSSINTLFLGVYASLSSYTNTFSSTVTILCPCV